MAAAFTGAAELAIDAEEAEQLALAAGKVLRHYNPPKVAGKYLDWLGLASTLGVIYGPRLIVLRGKARERKPPMMRPATSPVPPQAQPAAKPPSPPSPAAPQTNGAKPPTGTTDPGGFADLTLDPRMLMPSLQ